MRGTFSGLHLKKYFSDCCVESALWGAVEWGKNGNKVTYKEAIAGVQGGGHISWDQSAGGEDEEKQMD